jgi:hypothetical protein
MRRHLGRPSRFRAEPGHRAPRATRTRPSAHEEPGSGPHYPPRPVIARGTPALHQAGRSWTSRHRSRPSMRATFRREAEADAQPLPGTPAGTRGRPASLRILMKFSSSPGAPPPGDYRGLLINSGGWAATRQLASAARDASRRGGRNEPRGRVDWKYCLSLELADEGFEFTALNGVPGPAMSPRTCWCPAGCGASPRSARAGPYLRPGPGRWLHRGHVHHRLGPPPGHLPLGAVSSKFLSG